MDRIEAEIEIIKEFISAFNTTTPVSLENQPGFWYCTEPITQAEQPSNDIYVTFRVMDNNTSKSTLGTKGHRRFRRMGIVSSKVLVPEGVGTYDGKLICEEIISIFEGERIADDIVFTYGDIIPIGQLESGWYQYNVVVYFSFDEEK